MWISYCRMGNGLSIGTQSLGDGECIGFYHVDEFMTQPNVCVCVGGGGGSVCIM